MRDRVAADTRVGERLFKAKRRLGVKKVGLPREKSYCAISILRNPPFSSYLLSVSQRLSRTFLKDLPSGIEEAEMLIAQVANEEAAGGTRIV